MDRSQIRDRPPDNTHFRMQWLIVISDAIVVLVESLAVGADQDCPERSVPVIECRAGKFYTTTQTFQIDLAHAHRPEVYGSPASRQQPMFGPC